ncbi:MAG: TonB-dependent receptor [Pseudomonadota bacterium]
MLPRKPLAAPLAIALAAACAPAAADGEIDAIRAEIAAMKQHYETRIAALEARLQEAETRTAVPEPAAQAPATGGGRMNPDIGLILQGRYAQRDDLAERFIGGFAPVGGHAEGGGRGFSLDHSELLLSASVDPDWRGHAILAMADGAVEVEEAWFQSLGLGNGLTLKGGRFYSGLGYLNEQHPHAWDFADAPLMYQALFGERFSNDGLQLKWLAPTETYLEFGLEAGRGGVVAGEFDGNGVGAWTAFAKLGGDVGTDNSWRAGLAYLDARPRDRASHWEDANGVEAETLFGGSSRAWVADFVWKWAPDGNARERNFKFQAEYFRRAETGTLSCADNTAALPVAGACAGVSDAYRTRQDGWYAQGVYQFMPRWRAGLRVDRLDSGTQALGGGFTGVLAPVDYAPERYSLMLDYSPSEFSRFRVQYARDESMPGIDEDQWTLQYVMSLGAHGAHAF